MATVYALIKTLIKITNRYKIKTEWETCRENSFQFCRYILINIPPRTRPKSYIFSQNRDHLFFFCLSTHHCNWLQYWLCDSYNVLHYLLLLLFHWFWCLTQEVWYWMQQSVQCVLRNLGIPYFRYCWWVFVGPVPDMTMGSDLCCFCSLSRSVISGGSREGATRE